MTGDIGLDTTCILLHAIYANSKQLKVRRSFFEWDRLLLSCPTGQGLFCTSSFSLQPAATLIYSCASCGQSCWNSSSVVRCVPNLNQNVCSLSSGFHHTRLSQSSQPRHAQPTRDKCIMLGRDFTCCNLRMFEKLESRSFRFKNEMPHPHGDCVSAVFALSELVLWTAEQH
jgi:hypothetical protein